MTPMQLAQNCEKTAVRGKPFKAGADSRRNRGGRPKLPAEAGEVREAAREYSMEALETLVRLMRQRKSRTVALNAATALLDRAMGKPESMTVLAGLDGKPLFPDEPMPRRELAREALFILSSQKFLEDQS